MQFPDNFHYDGFASMNELTGEAVIKHKCGKYHGEVVQGAAEGLGALVLDHATYEGAPLPTSTGSTGISHVHSGAGSECLTFTGHWSGGLRHGTGILTFNGPEKHFYSGEWHQDQKHGWGIMQYPSGSAYEGEWMEDEKHGFGTMYWTKSNQRYRGGWKHDVPDGVGEHLWFGGAAGTKDTRAALLRCNRFVGMMVDGHRHGEGTMHYASGVSRKCAAARAHACFGTLAASTGIRQFEPALFVQVLGMKASGKRMPSTGRASTCLRTTLLGRGCGKMINQLSQAVHSLLRLKAPARKYTSRICWTMNRIQRLLPKVLSPFPCDLAGRKHQ